MNQLIPILNRVQEALVQIDIAESIPFPQIVVVGSQSSGKSSVLESLVGRDFLPRGTGIVTRRPLILQLENSHDFPEYAIFSHKPEQKFLDFNQVLREIELETDKLVGKKKGISDQPIRLKIISPNVIDITLVDLPGLTKNPVGDQPHNICDLIKEMVLKFIQNENSIILAVSAANSDLATSDSLKIAREVDPRGIRTLGVITKIDIMDRGTDCLDVLKGGVYPLSLGYIGVICRGQHDIDSKKSMRDHLDFEKLFFSNHEKYGPISSKLGIPHLAQVLNLLLKKHIVSTLPSLKSKIHDLIKSSDLELKNYGVGIQGNDEFKGVYMLGFISEFCEIFNKILAGNSASHKDKDVKGGAKIRRYLYRKYAKDIENIDPFSGSKEEEIRTAIVNSRGLKSSYLVPQEALEVLIKVQIRKVIEPSVQALQTILEILKNFIQNIEIPAFKVYDNLKPHFIRCSFELLDNLHFPTLSYIQETFENELAYINLDHPDLIRASIAKENAEKELNDQIIAKKIEESQKQSIWSKITGSKPSENVYQRETFEMLFTKQVVISYFNVMKKNFTDYTIKAIMTFLVKKFKDQLQWEFISKLYNEERFRDILIENPDIAEKRTNLLARLGNLRKASSILEGLREVL
jgi:replication fork clamp-binding protein CrfC